MKQRYIQETHPDFIGTLKCTDCPTTGIRDTEKHDKIHKICDQIIKKRRQIQENEDSIYLLEQKLRVVRDG